MKNLLSIFLVLASAGAVADGFRCGTRLVLVGDSIARLSRACGEPDRTFKARIKSGRGAARSTTPVTQWLYERRGKRAMIISVRGGTVVRIQRG